MAARDARTRKVLPVSAPFDNNRYVATIIRHIDADTTEVRVDYGFRQGGTWRFRWAGIDAPERYTEAGKVATAMVNHWLPVGSTCEIETIQDKVEKYGKYLAIFFLAGDTESLNDRLVRLGHATPYDGGAR